MEKLVGGEIGTLENYFLHILISTRFSVEIGILSVSYICKK